ncbi:hypothetical protein A5882_003516 [Enterococcus sp. 4E1_DIV0656]|uniref:hypothetical protein n=1 Tax=Enterococcus sp. 4E1_DIV0656 TaxID=1834180 RepID=UPI000A362330|nr:hypothetical protein [Enterococcus sp. 4E1_DIV0656]OTO09186.1 hypothetical protein A5882_003516 [Enterococcus sp. 4E1_DIV0656]
MSKNILKYQGNVIEIPAGVTVENARTLLASTYPEIANAEYTQSMDPVTGDVTTEFTVKSGTKGADTVQAVYQNSTIPLPAGTTADQAKTLLALTYPEISNADVNESVVNGVRTIAFTAKSGTKGADSVQAVYQNSIIPLPAGTTADQAKTLLALTYPEISNADVTETVANGVRSITFAAKSGTKGADTVQAVYQNSIIPLPAGTTADQAKTLLALTYPEISNADVIETVANGVRSITFAAKSGTKGI